MSLPDFVLTYFTSKPTLATLVLFLALLALLFSLFRLEKYRPNRRLRILFFSFTIEMLTWSFLGSSLLLCQAFLGLYQTGGDLVAVERVFSLSVLVSMAVALPLSTLVTFKVPRAIERRLLEDLPVPGRDVVEVGKKVATNLGVASLRLLKSPSGVPFAYSVGGAEGVVVVSDGLLARLEHDEVETVLAHELAHLKNHDTWLNTMIAVYRRVLFFDPFIRLLERAIYSEKEFSADELSARETKKPLSLASALLKISSAQSGGSPVKIEGLSILGTDKILRPPSVKLRIERLLMLSAELNGDSALRAGVPQVG